VEVRWSNSEASASFFVSFVARDREENKEEDRSSHSIFVLATQKLRSDPEWMKNQQIEGFDSGSE
jgi:hypothetical protein